VSQGRPHAPPDHHDEEKSLALSQQTKELAKALSTVSGAVAEAETSAQRQSLVFQHAEHGLALVDSEWKILEANASFCSQLALREEQLLGESLGRFRSTHHGPSTYREIGKVLKEGGRWTGELWIQAEDGREFPAILTLALVEIDPTTRNYVVDFADISKRKAAERDLDYVISYDRLTRLPNRSQFLEKLCEAIERGSASGERIGILWFGLDGFHLVNEAFGYPSGDQVLNEVGQRLQSSVRSQDLVARVGGDEFVILLRDAGDRAGTLQRTQLIQETMGKALRLQEQELFLSYSLGLSFFPDDTEHPEALIQNASSAMSYAKDHGRGLAFYGVELEENRRSQLQLGAALHHALERDELFLEYQPVLDVLKKEVIGCEALIRWRHPEKGIICPERFIPLAESTGLIRPIGRWVIESACKQLALWNAQGFDQLRVAVNLSVLQIEDPNLVQQIEELLSRNQVSPKSLEFEVTESVMVEQVDLAARRLHELKELGASVAIDDFGTGYSSLAYLKNFPSDTLKIDRSFVTEMEKDPRGDHLAGAMISLAHGLGLRVVGEGVETEQQKETLSNHGCDFLQGYLIGRPASPAELLSLIK